MLRRICDLAMLLCFLTAQSVLVHDQESHGSHKIPTFKKPLASVSLEPDSITITFGSIDLPIGHSGDLAASMPKHFFNLPEDRYMTGYTTEAFTKEGKVLPRKYLYHILLLDMDQDSISCPGEPFFFAGAGMEMRETRFPV